MMRIGCGNIWHGLISPGPIYDSVTHAVPAASCAQQNPVDATADWDMPDFIHPDWDLWARQDIHPADNDFSAVPFGPAF